MLKNKLLVASLFLGLSTSFAQLVLNSPYSRFGIGTTQNATNAFYQSMGGLSHSYASNKFINNINPALLSATANTTFDLGVGYSALNAKELGVSNNSQTVLFDYFRMAFPIKNRYAFAFSVSPYTLVNYSNKTTTVLDETTKAIDTYKGEGGISKLSITNSFSILKDSVKNRTFSLGIDAALLTGSIDKSSESLLNINGENNLSYTSYVNTNIYRGYQINVGTAYRKEIFVGNTFQTIKNTKCGTEKMGKIAVVQKIAFPEQIKQNAENSYITKYAIIYLNSNDIKIEDDIKNKDHRELLQGYYTSFIKPGYGVLVLKEAEDISFSDLKNDYLDFVKELKQNPSKERTTYENAKALSEQYLHFGSGIFFNIGASLETALGANISGSNTITRVRTSTTDPFSSYQLNEFLKENLVLPNTFRIGISLDKPMPKGSTVCGNSKKHTWVTGVDFSLQNWSNYASKGVNEGFKNTYKVVLGGSYTPNLKNENLKFNTRFRKLLNTTSYQLGINHQIMPFMYNNKAIAELGANAGFTVPTNHEGSLFTLSLGVSTLGNDLKQNYFKVGLGFTIAENNWFKPVRIGK